MEAIAIIGIGCRLPGGADNPRALWAALARGMDAVGPVPPERWDVKRVYDPTHGKNGHSICQNGSFLSGIDKFDPRFFGISPREAAAIDPQQRLLLEVGWEAIEDAVISADRLRGSSTGVFIGLSGDDWREVSWSEDDIDAYSGPGASRSLAAGRLSYCLDLRGPSMQVDTSCSSSLVALHLACRSLNSGECSMALVGGAHLNLSPLGFVVRSNLRALSSSGRCRAFDAGADGFVPGEGAGAVVLKRLADALADGDRIVATVRGTAIGHDGASNGLTAPNQQAQEATLRAALRDANWDPLSVDFIETHGTGTPLGDPVEVEALSNVYQGRKVSQRELWLGSSKTNFGHLEAAAGILSLIKTALSISEGTIPAHLHLSTLNPEID